MVGAHSTCTATSVGCDIPFDSTHSQTDIAPFFRVLENESEIANVLLDYSISQTTLEEVFMNVSYQRFATVKCACIPPSIVVCVCVCVCGVHATFQTFILCAVVIGDY